jgi:LysR family nitrogen assimilation transcriptional regulator
MVERGLGYTILTYAAVQDELARGALTVHPIVRPHLPVRVCIVTPRGDLPKLTRDASEMLREVCVTLVRNRRWAGAQVV